MPGSIVYAITGNNAKKSDNLRILETPLPRVNFPKSQKPQHIVESAKNIGKTFFKKPQDMELAMK